MTNNKPQEGIIGFYDILGYRSFLENNSFDVSATDIDNVLKTIANSDKDITKKVFDIFMRSNNANEILVKKLLRQMKWFIFSDSIIQVSTFKKNERSGSKYNKWLAFLIASLILNRYMLRFGLPLRGAIATGNFLFRKLCFAGKPILETYKLANSLDLSACVITDEAYNEVATLVNSSGYEKTKKLFNALIIKYQIPKNDKSSNTDNQNQKSLFTLNLLVPKVLKRGIIKKDINIHKYVLSKFEKHKKRVTEKENSKVENTKKFLEYLIDFAKTNKINGLSA